jgi:integrase/recombinase XerD
MGAQINLEQVIARYLQDSRNEGHSLATLLKKTKFFKRLLQFSVGREYSESLIQDFLQTFREDNLAPNSIRTYGVSLRAFTNWMVENYDCQKISQKLKIPKEKSKVLHLLSIAKTEQVIILGTTPGQYDNVVTRRKKLEEYRPAMQFAIRTGVRNAELRAIKGSDLILDDATPRLMIDSKGGNVDFVPIPVDMIGFLMTRVDRENVFDVDEKILRVALARGCKQLGVHKIGVHDLRHTFATNLLRRGVSLPIVSRLLRHSNIGITDKYYSHYIIEDLATSMNTQNELITVGLTDDVKVEYYRRQLVGAGVSVNNIHFDMATKQGSFSWA